MRFQVPQFIEVEDKIFGPLTIKQFIYLTGGAGLSFLVYAMADSIFLAALPVILIMALSCLLAFYKLHNKPFVAVMESAFKYYFGNKLYIWKKEDKLPQETAAAAARDAKNYASVMVPKISDSKLKDLTWSLDIKESVYSNRNQK